MSKLTNKHTLWLTDFCNSLRIFISIVMIQIAVFIYSFSFLTFDLEYLRKLSILTLMSQLVGIVLLIILCKLRTKFNHLTVPLGVLLLIILVVVFSILFSQIIGYLDLQLTFNMFESQAEVNHLSLKLSVSSVIISLALIRYFYIQDQYNRQIEKLSNAKLSALQARIKPHFLFNTLNSIASLISIDPEKAEIATTDFANLMRRTFTFKNKFISIAEELNWINQYLSIEKLRLADRLKYHISCSDELLSQKIPILCIQPLIENAIIHGIQPLEDGGIINIDITAISSHMVVIVNNPYLIKKDTTQSNGMALANIRERLQLQYGSKAYLTVISGKGHYSVRLGVPL